MILTINILQRYKAWGREHGAGDFPSPAGIAPCSLHPAPGFSEPFSYFISVVHVKIKANEETTTHQDREF